MRGERRLARRRQLQAARLDRPGCPIAVVEIDRRGADDLAVLHIDEKRAAIRHVAIAHRAVGHLCAEFGARALRHQHGLREPIHQPVVTRHAEGEFLLRVDLIEPVDRRRQQRSADRGILEGDRDVRVLQDAGAGGDLAVVEFEPAADLFVAGHELSGEIVLLRPGGELRIAPGGEFQQLRQPEQDDLQFQLRKHLLLPCRERRRDRVRSAPLLPAGAIFPHIIIPNVFVY